MTEQRPLLLPETVLGLISNSGVALSPDGATVAYRTQRPPRAAEPVTANVGELWSIPSAGGQATPLGGTVVDAHSPCWSPDGKQIAWIARDKPGGIAQIHLRAGAGAEVRVVTQSPGSISAFEWAPDGTRIAYMASDAKTEEQRQASSEGRDWYLFGEPQRQRRLYSVDVHTGKSWLLTQADMTVYYFAWSPRSDRLVIVAAPTESADDELLRGRAYTVDAAGGVPGLLADHFGRLAHPRWTADGKWIAWLASVEVTDPFHGSVFVMPADGSAAPRNLTKDYAGTATWLGPLPGRPATLAWVAIEGQATVLRSIDVRSGEIRLLSTPNAALSGAPSFSADGRTFASAASTPMHPDEVFVGRTDRPSPVRRLTNSNPQLESLQLGEQQVTRWHSKDGLAIEGVLIKPVGFKPGVRYPVVVHVHGGSESVILNGWRGSYIDWGQQLAARGYVTIYPNYRGSLGRGTAFAAGNRRDLMGREWEDIEAALDHVIALGIGDPERAGIYGFSWGGYAAGWGATFASHRFKAAVGGAGIYNWISEAGSNDTRMHEQLAHWDAPLYEHFPLYLERSPIYEIRKANTPMLLLHGELDQSCPLEQAIEMHTALNWKGVPVELVIYPREGHGMSERPHQKDFLLRGLDWFDRYLRATESPRS